MSEPGEKSRTKVWVISSIVIIISIICIVGGFFLFRGTETRETSNKENYSIGVLVCESGSPKDAFFSSSVAVSSKHTIKTTFKDEMPDKISYSYEGKFETDDLAESTSSLYHGNYNIDMGKNSLDPESLTPAFVAADKTVRINLYADVKDLKAALAKFFFLDSSEIEDFTTSSYKDIQKIYENVGFKCKYNN